jgi:hypothetical protein
MEQITLVVRKVVVVCNKKQQCIQQIYITNPTLLKYFCNIREFFCSIHLKYCNFYE